MGFELRSASGCERSGLFWRSAAKVANVVKLKLPFISAFSFSWVAEGVSTYEASPLPPPNPHLPHCT